MLDWFTIVAQIINFLALILLLRHFLYRPIVKAMDEREARIGAELAAAEMKQKEALLEAEAYRHKGREFEETRDHLFTTAKQEADAWRKQLMHKAHEEVKEAKDHWYRALEQEKDAFLQELRQRACHQTYVIARQALAELANEELESWVTKVFIERLGTLGEGQSAAIAGSLHKADVVVTSAFELAEEPRQQIGAAVREHLGNVKALRFETSRDLICGIELKTEGHRLAWSLADYLAALEVHNLVVWPGPRHGNGA